MLPLHNILILIAFILAAKKEILAMFQASVNTSFKEGQIYRLEKFDIPSSFEFLCLGGGMRNVRF